MIKAECDRCKVQLEVPDNDFLGGSRVPIPESWQRLFMPDAWQPSATSAEKWELCPECVNALRKFLATPPVTADAAARKPEDWVVRYGHMITVTETNKPGRVQVVVTCKEHDGWTVTHSFTGSGTDPVHVNRWLDKAMLTHWNALHTSDALAKHMEKCTHEQAGKGTCNGYYTRGNFPGHVATFHQTSEPEETGDRHDCPFCIRAFRGFKLGQHIASGHPGEWQAWADKQAAENRPS